MIETRFLKKYFQVYKQAAPVDVCFEFHVNPGLREPAFDEQPTGPGITRVGSSEVVVVRYCSELQFSSSQ